jgi:hypothetical protein
MENERAEWKTLEVEQTIELDVIRTALAGTQTTSATTESAVERGVELQRGQWTNRKKGRTPSLLRGESGGLLNFLVLQTKTQIVKKLGRVKFKRFKVRS